MANKLINETSPYLLQHADNPVDWYPWGPEALERAKAEDKPILLSVGYSACHWCHVMERESFEDGGTAAIMNESFVSIKVDREERPDIDSIYMSAVQAMTGRGGWPMTVFLTPEGKPFYGGTYFPPEDRHGLPGFPRLLQALAHAYREDRESVLKTTPQLVERMRQVSSGVGSGEPLTADLLQQAHSAIQDEADETNGGLGPQPKFPQPMVYEFLLRYHQRLQDPQALHIVELTLERMAKGGIYDQIGGGFHRYSTDAVWLVPHFEKMLYDNALLVKLYLHAYQVTGSPLYRRIVEETLSYVDREMTSPEGGFYSSQDADSEGVEGKFFVWGSQEVSGVLGKDDGEIVNRYYGVTIDGNFEGRNILQVAADVSALSTDFGSSEEDVGNLLSRSRARLLEARDQRVRPGRDEKVLTAWNGLMLRAFAEAGTVLSNPDYVGIANRNAKFILDNLRAGDRLLRTYKDGKAALKGYLEDYACLADGLIALHEATFDERWLREAIGLGRSIVELFWDEPSGRLYDTGHDHEELVVRPRDVSDNAMPSGGSMATDVLLRLAVITGDAEFGRVATAALRSAREMMVQFPGGVGHWLCALDFHMFPAKEIAIVGRRGDPETEALVSEVYRRFLPNRVFVGMEDGGSPIGLPLLEARDKVDGRPTAYVCQDYVCMLPATDPDTLARQLAH